MVAFVWIQGITLEPVVESLNGYLFQSNVARGAARIRSQLALECSYWPNKRAIAALF